MESQSWRRIALAGLVVVLAAVGLTFVSQFLTNPGADLANTRWSLISINGQPPVAGRLLTLSFGAGGQLSGDSGCNTYGAQYQIHGKALTIRHLVSTLRACAEQPLNDQEGRFQQALGNTARFDLQGQRLTLLDPGEGVLLVFERQS